MAQQPPPHLTPAALFDAQASMDAIRLQVYNRLLANVHKKIKFVSAQPNSTQMTSYDFPDWQPGCPRFDVKDCILYIAWNLRHSGFKVLYVSPNRLLISWKDQAVQYYQEESPIRQAMMTAASQGTRPTVAASGSASGSGSGSSKAEKKKAAAYKPAAEGVAGMLAGSGSGKKGGGATITFI
jgi:hypothetical protein